MTLIFGHTWEEIDAAQRGKGFNRPVVQQTPNPEATPDDIEMLETQGVGGLERMQLYGVLDRLKTSGLIA